jgi:hypothetical protein
MSEPFSIFNCDPFEILGQVKDLLRGDRSGAWILWSRCKVRGNVRVVYGIDCNPLQLEGKIYHLTHQIMWQLIGLKNYVHVKHGY